MKHRTRIQAMSPSPGHARRRAVTLTEMMVVMGIVVLVLGLSIPAISVWESRKQQDAINQISGLLKSAQIKALTEHRPIGLLFYVDADSSAQLIWPIEPALDPGVPEATADLFQLRDTAPFELPRPYRVAPGDVLGVSGDAARLWSAAQLVEDAVAAMMPDPPYMFDVDDGITGGTQFQRNLLVVLFDDTGRLVNDRRVFVRDTDPADNVQTVVHTGFRTGLQVSGVTAADDFVDNVIVGGPSDLPLYFGLTRGLLIYRDDEFRAQGDVNNPGYTDGHREYLRLQSDPLYVHPVTGRIIKGQRPDAA